MGEQLGGVADVRAFNQDLGMKCVSVKIFPQLLTQGHKENHFPVTSDLYKCAETDENLLKIS
jgi:hypothetical protein